MSKILNGRKLAQEILKDLKKKIAKSKIKPGLAVILIGKDPASCLYVRLKQKAAKEIGILFQKHLLPQKTSSARIISLIKKLNQNPKIQGIIVQMPLPQKIPATKIIKTINPQKDVDGFHSQNVKKILRGKPYLVSPLIESILILLKKTRVSLKNKKAVILARCHLFIKLLEKFLNSQRIKTQYFPSLNSKAQKQTLKADILIVALGKPRIIKSDMIKEKSIIIDVGINRVKGKVIGDVDFQSIKNKAAFITPVPGGVGPLTVAQLLKNTFKASKKS